MNKQSKSANNAPGRVDNVQNIKSDSLPNSKLKYPNRTQLKNLVDRLLAITSDCGSMSAPKLWEQYIEAHEILQKIIELEKGLDVFKTNRSEEAFAEFKHWMVNNGAKIGPVEIAEFEGYGLGLKATRDIEIGEKLLSVPQKVMIDSDRIKTSLLGKMWEACPMLKTMPNICLALLLLLERFNPESFWSPYITTLPDIYDTVMYFSPSEMELLKGTSVLEGSLKQCRSIARQYCILYSLFRGCNDRRLKSFKLNFSYSSYRWAVSTVMTRQNVIPREDCGASYALIPYWDMANHVNAPMSTDFCEDEGCVSFACRDFNQRCQVFICYGVRSNYHLFIHNGFILPDNRDDRLGIKLGISKADPLYKEKVRLLALRHLETPAVYELHVGDEPFSPELLYFVQIFNTTQVVEAERPGENKLEKRVWDFLSVRIKLLLSAYPTSLEEDKKMLAENNFSSSREKLAVLLMISEKNILYRAAKVVEENLRGIV